MSRRIQKSLPERVGFGKGHQGTESPRCQVSSLLLSASAELLTVLSSFSVSLQAVLSCYLYKFPALPYQSGESLPLPLYLLHNNVGFPPFPCLRKGSREVEIALVSKPLGNPSTPHLFLPKKKNISAPSVPIWKGICCHLNVIPQRGQNTCHLWQTSHLFLLLLPPTS